MINSMRYVWSQSIALEISSFLLPCEIQGSNSCLQTWWQTLLPQSQSSHWLLLTSSMSSLPIKLLIIQYISSIHSLYFADSSKSGIVFINNVMVTCYRLRFLYLKFWISGSSELWTVCLHIVCLRSSHVCKYELTHFISIMQTFHSPSNFV